MSIATQTNNSNPTPNVIPAAKGHRVQGAATLPSTWLVRSPAKAGSCLPSKREHLREKETVLQFRNNLRRRSPPRTSSAVERRTCGGELWSCGATRCSDQVMIRYAAPVFRALLAINSSQSATHRPQIGRRLRLLRMGRPPNTAAHRTSTAPVPVEAIKNGEPLPRAKLVVANHLAAAGMG